MNAKQVKKVRQQLRTIGVNVKDASYIQHKATGVISLRKDCGRKIFKQMKKDFANFLANSKGLVAL